MNRIPVRLRAAEPSDERLLWEWANDPAVRDAAFSGADIPYEDHARWFSAKLADPRSRIYIAIDPDDAPIGQVRVDTRDDRTAEIDFSVASPARGRGVGAALLRALPSMVEGAERVTLVGRVKRGNQASAAAFASAGFEKAPQDAMAAEDVLVFRLDVPPRATARYIAAVSRPWAEEALRERLGELPGEWSFAHDPTELSPERVSSIKPQIIFLLHWSWKVPDTIVAGYECIGFHMTDLPFGRGGSPLQNLIVRGFTETRLTAFSLAEGMDTGAIYAKMPLALHGRAEEIYGRASRLAVTMIEDILRRRPEPVPQSGEPTVFQRRRPAESVLPDGLSPDQLYDFIRMLDAPGYPLAFVDAAGYRLELSHAALHDGRVDARVTMTRLDSKESSR
jgi:methionyl-tRNA formyltransferase